MTRPKPFDLDRALEEVRCPICAAGGWTVRVTAYGPAGHPDVRFSQYACDECVPMVLAIVRREHPDAEVFDLPGKAHPQRLPLAGPDPTRHVDLAVADQVEALLTGDPGGG